MEMNQEGGQLDDNAGGETERGTDKLSCAVVLFHVGRRHLSVFSYLNCLLGYQDLRVIPFTATPPPLLSPHVDVYQRETKRERGIKGRKTE